MASRSTVVLSLLLAVAYISGFAIPASAATNRPNFLFIYTDDQRWDAMGVVQREQGERARFPGFEVTPHPVQYLSPGFEKFPIVRLGGKPLVDDLKRALQPVLIR